MRTKLDSLAIWGQGKRLSESCFFLSETIAKEYAFLPFSLEGGSFEVGDLVEAEFEVVTMGEGQVQLVLCRNGATPFEAATEFRQAANFLPRIRISHMVQLAVPSFRLQVGLAELQEVKAGVCIELRDVRIQITRADRVIALGYAFVRHEWRTADIDFVKNSPDLKRIEGLFSNVLDRIESFH